MPLKTKRNWDAPAARNIAELAQQHDVLVCGEDYCPFVSRARAGLKRANIKYEYVGGLTSEERKEMRDLTGIFTIPQVFVHGISIGGCEDGNQRWQGTVPLLQRGALQKALQDKENAKQILMG